MLRADPNGAWTRHFHQFPGSGTDYPLAPGQTAVVARDAIDHSQIHPSFPDLTHADFELLGYSDVDNAAVPNMPEIGVAPYSGGGHGIDLWVNKVFFLSEGVNVEALPRMWVEGATTSYEWARIPREALLDVLATEGIHAVPYPWDPCLGGRAHRDFDRLEGGFIEHTKDLEYSVQRIILGTTPDGRAILQDTNTSAVDLIRAPYTVGTLPQRNEAPLAVADPHTLISLIRPKMQLARENLRPRLEAVQSVLSEEQWEMAPEGWREAGERWVCARPDGE